MLEFLDRGFLLHLLLNAASIALGLVVGVLVAWKLGLERRFDVRRKFLMRLVAVDVAFALLITLLAPDAEPFVAGVLIGLLAGFGASYMSRAQAKPK